MRRLATQFVLLAVIVSITGGCSFKRMAVNKVGDALAGSGTTFASDNDPELIKDAAPFSLKLMESLLAESPRHKGLLFATASGFTQYSYAFVQLEADEIEGQDVAKADEMRTRAKKLYVRARDYGLRGLDAGHRGFSTNLAANPVKAVAVAGKKDVPMLYWTAASWAAAISLSKDDAAFIGEIPQMEALIDRARALDESFDDGAIHTFLISYEMARQGAAEDAVERAQKNFARAVELSNGEQAGPYVAYAESVCVQKQDVKQFDEMLGRALAIDPDAQPQHRLVNLIMQRRARWLVSQRDELFLITDATETSH